MGKRNKTTTMVVLHPRVESERGQRREIEWDKERKRKKEVARELGRGLAKLYSAV